MKDKKHSAVKKRNKTSIFIHLFFILFGVLCASKQSGFYSIQVSVQKSGDYSQCLYGNYFYHSSRYIPCSTVYGNGSVLSGEEFIPV